MGQRIMSFRWINLCVPTVRGVHFAGNQKCPVRKRQVEVARVVQKLSYAEAVKKVEEDGLRGRDPERSGVSSRFILVQRDRLTGDICFSKIGFLAFIEMVINCTAGMKHKSQKIEVVVLPIKEVFVCTRLDFRRVTGCVEWWCPILSGCCPDVGINRLKLWSRVVEF